MCDAQGLRADRIETKQVWVRFGGRSRPVDIRRDQEGEFEATAREMMGIQADVEFYLVADGRSIGWKEAERLEDRMVVEVFVSNERWRTEEEQHKSTGEEKYGDFRGKDVG